MRMERFLMEHNQLPKRSARILEINGTHPFFSYMASIQEDASRSAEFDDAAQLLLDQACIIDKKLIYVLKRFLCLSGG